MSLPDYNDLFDRHETERANAISRFPKCVYCDEHIFDDFLFDLDGDLVCETCLNENFKKHTEDYID